MFVFIIFKFNSNFPGCNGNFFIEFKKSGKHAGIQILFINPWRLIKTMNRCQEGLLLVGKLKEDNKKATKDSSSNNNNHSIHDNKDKK